MENAPKLEEYLFIDDIQELFSVKAATTTSWGVKFSYKNKPDENSIYIFALVDKIIKRMVFTKMDLKNIRKMYKIIKIYFGPLSVNLICNQNDNKDNILLKINNLPDLKLIITNTLNINQYPLNKFVINEWKVYNENFDEIYKLEFRDANNNDNIEGNANIKPKTNIISTKLVLHNIKYINNINNQKTKVYYKRDSKDDFNLKDSSRYNLKNPFSDMNLINRNNNHNLMHEISNNNELNLNKNLSEQLVKEFINRNKMQGFLNDVNPNNIKFKMQNQFIFMPANNNVKQNNSNNNNKNQNNNNANQKNLHNNNQMKNFNFMINYEEVIEKTANQFFKNIFFSGFEKGYFPKKGLNNVGLTCYMNSTLQCLLHVPELNHYFTNCFNEFKEAYKNVIQKTETKGKISEEYYKLLKNIWGNSRFSGNAFAPKDFNDLISKLNPQFSKYESNDAKDLIIYLFQEMHEELNYFGEKKLGKIPKCNQLIESEAFNFFYEINSKLNFSIISYLFWGIVKQTTTCKGCKNNFYNYQYYQYLSFPLYKYAKDKFNLYKGLKDYVSEEILKGDNQFYCQHCRCLRDAKIFSNIYYTAPYLLINFDYGKNKKYNPKTIDFGSTIYLDKTFLDENIQVNYELIAVSTHLGDSGNSGHYITYCKDISSENTWYKFNDSSVSLSSFEETKKNSPYLLLFKKGNKIY